METVEESISHQTKRAEAFDAETHQSTAPSGDQRQIGLAAQRHLEQRTLRRRGPLNPATLLHLQRTSGNQAAAQLLTEPDGHSPVLDVVGKGGGSPLEPSLRAEMSQLMGADFSPVRIHTDAKASDSAEAVQAHAYTVGNEVVFGRGAYSPHTRQGKHTIAHELTHVIQQSQGPVDGGDTGQGVSVSDPSDCFEREAEATATQAMRGASPALQQQRLVDRADIVQCVASSTLSEDDERNDVAAVAQTMRAPFVTDHTERNARTLGPSHTEGWSPSATRSALQRAEPSSNDHLQDDQMRLSSDAVQLELEEAKSDAKRLGLVKGFKWSESVEKGFKKSPVELAGNVLSMLQVGWDIGTSLKDTGAGAVEAARLDFSKVAVDAGEVILGAVEVLSPVGLFALCTDFLINLWNIYCDYNGLEDYRVMSFDDIVAGWLTQFSKVLEAPMVTWFESFDPTRADEIRMFVGSLSPNVLQCVPVKDKVKMINRMLDWWVSDADLDVINTICVNTAGSDLAMIARAIEPREIDIVSLHQRSRLRAILRGA